ncbi:MAG: hypothetical protein DRO00_03140 [Thermoproteota archaeon]|nr:MAG: hypothetical protein DRO00_03140 [Candidatus Korarchaeota archaeon]
MLKQNRILAIPVLILLVFQNSAVVILGNTSEDALNSILKVADWLVANQNLDGTFNLEMSHMHSEYQDAMILGCAAIVLLETYQITEDYKYLKAANLTLTLLANWQEIDGDWSSHSRYAAGGVYYPIMAFAKFQIYTGSDFFMDNMIRAAESLIKLAEEKSVRYYYVFEMGERSYALLLVWKATNISRYKKIANKWVRFLVEEAFDHKAGSWNTRIDGKGPQGMWDVVLPTLPLLVSNYVTLRELANLSFYWALENLSSFEPGAYVPASPRGEMVLSNDVYRDQTNAYPHFVAEFLILATVLGRDAEAREAVEWLISMQAPDGGFYFRKNPDGSIDKREYVWDSFWAFFGLHTYLQRKMPEELGSLISEMESQIQTAEAQGINTSIPRKYLMLAQESLNSEKYLKAMNCLQKANRTLKDSSEAFDTINEVKSLISSIKEKGANVSAAELKLGEAINAYNKGDYDACKELALNAENLANLSLLELKLEAFRVLEDVRAFLNETASTGLNLTEAEILFSEALKLYSEGNYTGAIELAKSARQMAIEALSLTEAKKTRFLAVGIIVSAIVSILSIVIWRRHEAKRKELEMKEFIEEFGDVLEKYVILLEKEESEDKMNG